MRETPVKRAYSLGYAAGVRRGRRIAQVARAKAREGWERECDDADKLLRLMFPDQEPGTFRSEGGLINLPKVRALWGQRAHGVKEDQRG